MSRPIQSLSSRVCLPTVCPRCQTCCRALTAHSYGARTKTDPEPARSVGLGDATPLAHQRIHSSPTDNGTVPHFPKRRGKKSWTHPDQTLVTPGTSDSEQPAQLDHTPPQPRTAQGMRFVAPFDESAPSVYIRRPPPHSNFGSVKTRSVLSGIRKITKE